MIIKSLQLKNFKQYQALELDFQEGLVGIIGKNGAGKSTIFEGILLCLFGSINTDKDFYKTSWAADKEAVSLELTFEVNQKVYRVQRSFRGKKLTHQAALYDQKEVQIANGASTVNEEVAKTIGMDKEAFTRSIFSGQKELGVLSNTRGEERKRMIRKMIGLDNLDKIQQLIRDDRNSIKKQIQGQEALLLSTEEVKRIEQEIKQLKKILKTQLLQLEKVGKNLQKQQDKYVQAKEVFEMQLKKDQRFRQLKNELNNYHLLLEELDQQLLQQKSRIEELKQKKAEQIQLAPQIKIHLDNKTRKNLMEEEKQKFNEAQKLEQTQILYQDRIKEIRQNIQTCQKAVEAKGRLEKAQEQQNHQIKQLKIELEALELNLQNV
ncbi:MAG: SMC family ATPase, partial [Bacteroidota bacterium]